MRRRSGGRTNVLSVQESPKKWDRGRARLRGVKLQTAVAGPTLARYDVSRIGRRYVCDEGQRTELTSRFRRGLLWVVARGVLRFVVMDRRSRAIAVSKLARDKATPTRIKTECENQDPSLGAHPPHLSSSYTVYADFRKTLDRPRQHSSLEILEFSVVERAAQPCCPMP